MRPLQERHWKAASHPPGGRMSHQFCPSAANAPPSIRFGARRPTGWAPLGSRHGEMRGGVGPIGRGRGRGRGLSPHRDKSFPWAKCRRRESVGGRVAGVDAAAAAAADDDDGRQPVYSATTFGLNKVRRCPWGAVLGFMKNKVASAFPEFQDSRLVRIVLRVWRGADEM